MREVEITGAAASKIEGGYPQLSLKDLEHASDATNNGEWVALVRSGHFVASAYLAEEGHGIGWILSRKANQTLDTAFFAGLMRQAFQRRAPLVEQGVTAYRLFNGIGDGLGGLTIDNFAGQVLLTWENEGLYRQRELLLTALTNTLAEYQNLYELRRGQPTGTITPVNDLAPAPVAEQVISESGTEYPIQLTGASKPGLELAYRPVRTQIKKHSRAKLTLHLLFDQTGFVTASLTGGAVQTEAVDQKKHAKPALVTALAANELTTTMPKVRTMDLLGFLDYATKHQLHFELITINVPAFLRSKKATFNIRKDLSSLLTQVLALTTKQADLFMTTQTPAITTRSFRQVAQRACQTLGRNFMEKQSFQPPRDFPVNREFQKESPVKGLWFKLQK
ncbi:class I SAM-dependent methyltransferase [Fructilactobacillus ixorae]|uniref:Class I SAM-dependent methyltransferase n=1 Tax=Fructilactobacillus ixorae TaxID=1750535 RepID=A0ABY5C7W3_9LACO|nr:class I SAM-dependent methyltransferase [Fructilactobacillus ixorae]USS93693.1 class I SAM-dependent methyltransferase [Fructilactobacillus ixorae]